MTNGDIIREHYAASARGDLAGMLAPMSETVRWVEASGSPYAGTHVGPAAVAENVFARIHDDWEDFTFDVDEVIDAGGTVVGIGTYHGTHRRTGKSFEARVTHVWRLQDGHVVSFEQIADTASIVAATA